MLGPEDVADSPCTAVPGSLPRAAVAAVSAQVAQHCAGQATGHVVQESAVITHTVLGLLLLLLWRFCWRRAQQANSVCACRRQKTSIVLPTNACLATSSLGTNNHCCQQSFLHCKMNDLSPVGPTLKQLSEHSSCCAAACAALYVPGAGAAGRTAACVMAARCTMPSRCRCPSWLLFRNTYTAATAGGPFRSTRHRCYCLQAPTLLGSRD